MPVAPDRAVNHPQDEAAARLARRLDRELALRTRRRRAAVLAITLGAILLVGGLSVALARGGRFAEADRTTPPRILAAAVATQPPVSVASETTGPAPTASAPARSATLLVARTASPAKVTPKRVVAPVAQAPSAAASGSDILIQKCAGSGCHSTSEVSRGGLDRQSAEGAIQAMTDNGYIKLTSAQLEAVIAALIRK